VGSVWLSMALARFWRRLRTSRGRSRVFVVFVVEIRKSLQRCSVRASSYNDFNEIARACRYECSTAIQWRNGEFDQRFRSFRADENLSALRQPSVIMQTNTRTASDTERRTNVACDLVDTLHSVIIFRSGSDRQLYRHHHLWSIRTTCRPIDAVDHVSELSYIYSHAEKSEWQEINAWQKAARLLFPFCMKTLARDR
jgi:hypothetical protein